MTSTGATAGAVAGTRSSRTTIDFDTGVPLSSADVVERHQHVGLWVVGGGAAPRGRVGDHSETARATLDSIFRDPDEVDDVAVGDPEPGQVRGLTSTTRRPA